MKFVTQRVHCVIRVSTYVLPFNSFKANGPRSRVRLHTMRRHAEFAFNTVVVIMNVHRAAGDAKWHQHEAAE